MNQNQLDALIFAQAKAYSEASALYGVGPVEAQVCKASAEAWLAGFKCSKYLADIDS